LLGIHIDDDSAPRFREAIAALPLAWQIATLRAGDDKASYEALAAQLRWGDERLLPALLQYLGLDPESAYERIIALTFRDGHTLVRELLTHPLDAARLDGWIGFDAAEPALAAGGAKLAPFARLAQRAAAGEALLWIGHGEASSPQMASSAAHFADELARLCALDLTPPPVRASTNGLLVIRGPEPHLSAAPAHSAALRAWGPSFASMALAAFAGNVSRKGPEAIPAAQQTAAQQTARLGERAVEIALEELNAGVQEEPPGSNSGPRIRLYLAGCVRNGRPIGIQAGEWCAAGACWTAAQAIARDGAARFGDKRPPHEYRAAVRELYEDAVKAGAYRAKGESYTPRRGDLVVFKRDGDDPRKGGKGHVGRVLDAPDESGRYRTIEANKGVRWAIVDRRLGDADLLGWIQYP